MSSISTDSVMGVRGILKPQELRRSARLAAKPQKCYKIEDPYDSEDLPDDAELDDEMDEIYEYNRYEDYNPYDEHDYITDINKNFRSMLKWYSKIYKMIDEFTDENVGEVVKMFEEYYEANKNNDIKDDIIWENRLNWKTDEIVYYPNTLGAIIHSYLHYSKKNASKTYTELKGNAWYNSILHRGFFNILYRKIMKREVSKIDMEYDERLMDGFWNWYNNHDNYKKIVSLYYYTPHYNIPEVLCANLKMKPEIVRAYLITVPKRCDMFDNIEKVITTECPIDEEQDDWVIKYKGIVQYETYKNAIKKQLARISLEYNERMVDDFKKWRSDRNNRKYIRSSNAITVRSYLKTLPKRFIF